MSTQKEKQSMLSNEDQFFFGLVITLLIFLLQLPTFDVAKIFENFGVKVPSTTIITTQMIVIVLLILSSGSRYVTALTKKEEKRNKWRMISVTLLLSCIYFEIFDLIIRGLSPLLTGIDVFLIFLSPILLSVVSVILASCLRFRILPIIVVSASPFFFMSIAKFMRSWLVSVETLAS